MFGFGAPEILIVLVVLGVPAFIIGVVVFAVAKAADRNQAGGAPLQGVPPGWHPDPTGPAGQLRYWDGLRWTDQTATQ